MLLSTDPRMPLCPALWCIGFEACALLKDLLIIGENFHAEEHIIRIIPAYEAAVRKTDGTCIYEGYMRMKTKGL